MPIPKSMLGLAAGLVLAAGVASAQSAQPVRIATIDSADADFISYAMGGVLQKAGFNVEYIRVDYSAMVPALETGDLDVVPAIWDTTSWYNMSEAFKAGTILNFGSTGVEVIEGWWYPDYMTEICPGLPDWTALKNTDCVAALSTVETEPRGRFIDAPADWETEAQLRFDALGLEFEAVSSGSPVTMVTTLKSAVDKKQPIMGFAYVPHWYFEDVPGDWVQFPAYDDQCFADAAWGENPDSTHDCGYRPGYIWKLGSNGFNAANQDAARLVHLFTVSTADVSKATGAIEIDGRDVEDVAAEWIENNQALWAPWIR
jgi:glycine betaine/proline transport system substrate-binding protein